MIGVYITIAILVYGLLSLITVGVYAREDDE